MIVGGVIDPSHTGDREEAAECEKMHGLIAKYSMQVGRVGWRVVGMLGTVRPCGGRACLRPDRWLLAAAPSLCRRPPV